VSTATRSASILPVCNAPRHRIAVAAKVAHQICPGRPARASDSPSRKGRLQNQVGSAAGFKTAIYANSGKRASSNSSRFALKAPKGQLGSAHCRWSSASRKMQPNLLKPAA
jgi:hypothetical protein